MTALLQAAFVLPLHEQGIEVCCTVVRNKFWRFGLIAAVRSAPTTKRVEVTRPDSNARTRKTGFEASFHLQRPVE